MPPVVTTGPRSDVDHTDDQPDRADDALPWRPDPVSAYCGRCGATAGPGAATAEGCPFCRGQRVPWDRVVRLSDYTPPMSQWIKSMKFSYQWSWAPFLGRCLAEALPDTPADQRWVVCPVPMPWPRRWWRGFNQAQLIAQAMADARDLTCAPILRRTRYTTPQTTLTRTQRQANVRGSLALRRVDLHGWRVWLVDDVKTSGATLHACCRLLREAGAEEIGIAVAAVADPSGQDFQIVTPAKTSPKPRPVPTRPD